MSNTSFTSKSLWPAFLFLMVAVCVSSFGFAQNSETNTVMVNTSSEIKKTKTIQVETVNGEQQVTVTSIHNGEKTTVIYTGEAAEKYLAQQMEQMETDVHKIQLKEMEDMQFTFNVEGMETGDAKRILIVTEAEKNSHPKIQETIVWSEENNDIEHLNMSDINVNVTDGADGELMKIEMSYTDENGKKVDRTMVIDEAKVNETMKDVQELLNDLDIDIDIDFDREEPGYENTKIIVISEQNEVEKSQRPVNQSDASEMLSEFSIEINASRKKIKVSLTPIQESPLTVLVSGIDGNELFSETYDGKGRYSKSIPIDDYHGVVVLTITQGKKATSKKVIVE